MLPPDRLFARVIRPPVLHWRGDWIARLAPPRIDDASSVRARPGIIAVVQRGHFVAVVAESPEAARSAAAELRVDWGREPDPPTTVPQPPSHRRTLLRCGDPERALANAAQRLEHTYRWPVTLTPGRGAAVAQVESSRATLWLSDEPPRRLSSDLAVLLGLPGEAIQVMAAAVPESTDEVLNFHAAADAALLAQILGRAVQVNLFGDAPMSGGPTSESLGHHIDGGVDADGHPSGYVISTLHEGLPVPWALLLTGCSIPGPSRHDNDEAGAVPAPPYLIEDLQVTQGFAAPALTAPGTAMFALAQNFAVESFCDETSNMLGVDPVTWRLGHLEDVRGAALIRETAQRAGWRNMPRAARDPNTTSGIRRGRGFAYAGNVVWTVDPRTRSWAAWVVDVEVDTHSGDVTVKRVVVGHDAESMALDSSVNPAPQITRRPTREHAAEMVQRLLSQAAVDRFELVPAAPTVETLGNPVVAPDTLPARRQGRERVEGDAAMLYGSPTAVLPAAAAIGNAIFNATGVRLREPPFTAERVRRGLEEAGTRRAGRRRTWAGALGGIAGTLALMMPWRASIAPVAPPGPGYFSDAAIERGRIVAAAGDCAVCHTTQNGAPLAGGLGIDTPFGTVFSTNITPDRQTGIGEWSFAAFERAMRAGIHRDGSHLYPVFPYTAYASMSEDDLLVLYAYLMSQTPVHQAPQRSRLTPPFGWRPLLAGWKMLFHRNQPFVPNPARSADWNRGAYLIEGLGHCGGCHSPRNFLGAERGGRAFLAGGTVDGWEAPALNGTAPTPTIWTAGEFFDYLRHGYSPAHGAAVGPMAAVVREMSALPDEDLRAMAVYLAAMNHGEAAPSLGSADVGTDPVGILSHGLGARIYRGACAMCHEPDEGPPAFGVKVSLANATTLHAASATNLLRVLFDGAEHPPTPMLGYMPAFGDTLDDSQLAALAAYLRARFAAGKPAWRELEKSAAALRVRRAAS